MPGEKVDGIQFTQVQDPHHKYDKLFDKCQADGQETPLFCLTKPMMVKKVAKKVEGDRNGTGSQFYSNRTNTKTIDLQQSSIKILKNLMEHKAAKDAQSLQSNNMAATTVSLTGNS